jgi:hypothetical protein
VITEGLGLTDDVNRLVTSLRRLTDSAGCVDVDGWIRNRPLAIVDSLGASDQWGKVVRCLRLVTEQLGIVDELRKQMVFRRLVTDAFAIANAVTKLLQSLGVWAGVRGVLGYVRIKGKVKGVLYVSGE